MTITKSLKAELGLPADTPDKDVCAAAVKATKAGTITKSRISELMAQRDATNPDPQKVFAGATSEKAAGMPGGDPRVRHIKEKFNQTKATEVWPDNREHARKGLYEPKREAFYWETIPGLENTPLDPKNPGGMTTAQKKPILAPSEYEIAKMGALYKSMLIRDCGAENVHRITGFKMTEEDQKLVDAAIHDDEWVGPGANAGEEMLTPRLLKSEEKHLFKKSGL